MRVLRYFECMKYLKNCKRSYEYANQQINLVMEAAKPTSAATMEMRRYNELVVLRK